MNEMNLLLKNNGIWRGEWDQRVERKELIMEYGEVSEMREWKVRNWYC